MATGSFMSHGKAEKSFRFLKKIENYTVAEPVRYRSGSGWVWASRVVIHDPKPASQSTRDLDQKPTWSPVRSSRARPRLEKSADFDPKTIGSEVETITPPGWYVVYDT